MRIDDVARMFKIHQSVLDFVQNIEAETRKPIEVRVDPTAKAPASVKVARERMNYHLIKIQASQAAVAGYLIANKCANIQRMLHAKPNDRVVPMSNEMTMNTAHVAINAQRKSGESPYAPQLLTMWTSGIITQVTNLPTQIRIEQWIHESLPELRSEQQLYLEKEVKQAVAGTSTDVERVTPRFVFETSNAMTYAFVRGIGELFGINFTQRYNDYRDIVRRGKELFGMVLPDDGSYATDVQIINEWAMNLNVDGWFQWKDFEDMPESYYSDVGS